MYGNVIVVTEQLDATQDAVRDCAQIIRDAAAADERRSEMQRSAAALPPPAKQLLLLGYNTEGGMEGAQADTHTFTLAHLYTHMRT